MELIIDINNSIIPSLHYQHYGGPYYAMVAHSSLPAAEFA